MATAVVPKKLTSEFRELIARTVAEVLSDQDFGLELTAKAKQRLRRAQVVRAKTIPLSLIKKKYL